MRGQKVGHCPGLLSSLLKGWDCGILDLNKREIPVASNLKVEREYRALGLKLIATSSDHVHTQAALCFDSCRAALGASGFKTADMHAAYAVLHQPKSMILKPPTS